jgi:hypothetical protein
LGVGKRDDLGRAEPSDPVPIAPSALVLVQPEDQNFAGGEVMPGPPG